MKTKQMLLAMEVYCTYLNNCSNRVGAEYKVFNLDSCIQIAETPLYDIPEVYVSKTEMNDYNFSMSSQVDYDEINVKDIIEALVEYAKTPLEERGDLKRFYIRLIDDIDGYLNYDKENRLYFIDNVSEAQEDDDYQVKFSRSEIESWAGTDNNVIIDWLIKKFGEEVK